MRPHFPLPLPQIHLLHSPPSQRCCSVPASTTTMVKEKTAALERAKKATAKAKGRATSRGRSSSRAGLPQGWVQGDWICSTIRQKDLDDLANERLIPHGSARLPRKEWQPQPQEGECVLLATHVDRGFSLPPSPFLGISELLWGATPPLHTQLYRLSRCFCVLV